MLFTSRFWRAFWAGLAAPVSLYEDTPDYPRPLRTYTVGQSFAEVGRSLSRATRAVAAGTCRGRRNIKTRVEQLGR